MAKKTIRTIPQERTPMREQDPRLRAKNFAEVNCGYSVQEASREAERCLLCPDQPCVSGCPVGIDIPGFIQKISAKDFRGAYDVITETNLLAAVCGRVCPQEAQCEGVCTVGKTLEPVAIGRLERFVGDQAIAEGWSNVPYCEPSGLSIGIVGAGPAGMACAADMAKAGCEVTVYEAFHQAGGVLKYGIPDFRLPNKVVDAEIDNLRKLGVEFVCNTLVGRLFTIAQMIDEMGHDAVFIGTGAGYPSMLGIPGDSLNGVLSANELLTRCNLMRAKEFPNFDTPIPVGRRVAVIGAGNTAMDAMRVCLRLGAEKVYCIYRRSRAECPARVEEVHHAEQEGVEFHWLTAPVEILDDGKGSVRSMRCVRMELGEPDSSGRRRPVPVAGSEYDFEADMIVYAIGTNANPIIGQTSKLKLDKRGYIETDESLATSMAGVYAGGDIVTGAATVIEAMGAGRKAARSIKAYLGIRDAQRTVSSEILFGIDVRERNFVRIRLANNAEAAEIDA
jgi:glutamate synthase (NADPH/NADH) small chain